jgi:hypothetical protein
MTTFSYTTGNPSNLTAGATASMNDIQGPFTDLRTFVNGANIDTTNLATSAKPVTLLGRYSIDHHYSCVAGGLTATTWYPGANGGLVAHGATSGAALVQWFFTSADYAVSGLSPQMRLQVGYGVNGTSTGTTFTATLNQITSYASANNAIGVATVSPVAGSSVSLGSPTAGTSGVVRTSDFAVPNSSNGFIVGIAAAGTQTVFSFLNLTFELQVHYV